MSTQNSETNVIPIHVDDMTADDDTDAATSPDNDNTDEMDARGENTPEEIEPSEEDIKRGLRLLEALLFASAEPLSERLLSNRLPEHLNVKTLLKALQEEYAERGVNLVRVGNSWAFRTAEDLSAVLNVEAEVSRKMSRATIETMAIVAYHQPVTRAEIEEIRGVSLSKGTLDALFEKEWIKPRGRRETPGRPMTWGTTDVFLDHFGLSRVTDLPGMDELKAAGLLESGPALNVYRSRSDQGDAPPEGAETDASDTTGNTDAAAHTPFSQHGEEDALPDVVDDAESEEPLDPEAS